MCTGVRSSVTLDKLPEAETWKAFDGNPNYDVTVTRLCDGRFHVACFAAVAPLHPDLRNALRDKATTLRSALDRLAA